MVEAMIQPNAGGRIVVRVTTDQRSRFERAAARAGRRLAAFVIDALEREAEAVDEIPWSPETIKLSKEDSILFVETLLNPPEPNARMCAAARDYRAFMSRQMAKVTISDREDGLPTE